MSSPEPFFIGKSVKPGVLTLPLANRHGLITGATGTGKTVTPQILAGGLSPVFRADIKGDLSCLATGRVVALRVLHDPKTDPIPGERGTALA